ncbi:hypothetical protein GIB67_000071, partial [Kingdonia uniflora]
LDTIIRCMAHYNPFDNLQLSGDDSNTIDTGNNFLYNVSFKKKRGLSRGLKLLPNGKKKKIGVNLRGNNPGDVKASPAPEFVPREDWVKFVDYCNSEKFLAKSKRNKENRAKLIASCTLGRTSMPIICHKLAEERDVTDEEIELQNTMQKDPKSIRRGSNDAIAQKFGKERKGGTRGMGTGMSISLVEKVCHIVNENEELRSTNNKLKFSTEKLEKDLDALAKYIGNIPMQDNYGASGYFFEVGGTSKRKHVEALKLTEVSASNKLESFRAAQEILDLLEGNTVLYCQYYYGCLFHELLAFKLADHHPTCTERMCKC